MHKSEFGNVCYCSNPNDSKYYENIKDNIAIIIVVNIPILANHAANLPYLADSFEIRRLSSASCNAWFSFSNWCKKFKPVLNQNHGIERYQRISLIEALGY